jgi:N-formylmaleamate deformylase
MKRVVAVLAITLAACGGKAKSESAVPDEAPGEVFGEKAGRPIIFIPGLGCPGEVWNETADRLEGFESHILTLSGFAGTPPIELPLSETVRKELTRYIRAKRMERPVIVGHSMGGFIAFWIATNFPENTGPVVIVDAGPALSGDLDEARMLREKWRYASDEEFARQARFMYQGMARNKKALAPIAAKAAKSDRAALGNAIYEMMITNLTSEMPKIESPVLLLLADGYFKPRILKQVERIKNKTVKIFKTGHFVMLDDPDGFIASMQDFLDENE